jgi:hypothetical protein
MSEGQARTSTRVPALDKIQPASDSAPFQQRLKQYAAAALGMAGASVLATAQTPPMHHNWRS